MIGAQSDQFLGQPEGQLTIGPAGYQSSAKHKGRKHLLALQQDHQVDLVRRGRWNVDGGKGHADESADVGQNLRHRRIVPGQIDPMADVEPPGLRVLGPRNRHAPAHRGQQLGDASVLSWGAYPALPQTLAQPGFGQGHARQGVLGVECLLLGIGLHQCAKRGTGTEGSIVALVLAVQSGQGPDLLGGSLRVAGRGQQLFPQLDCSGKPSGSLRFVHLDQRLALFVVLRSQRHTHLKSCRRRRQVRLANPGDLGQTAPQGKQVRSLVGRRRSAQPLDHVPIGTRQLAPVLLAAEDALDALEAAAIVRVLVERLVIELDGLDRGLQLVVQDIGDGNQVASLVLARLGLHQLLQHIHRAPPLLQQRVDLHQLVQRLRIVGTQGKRLLKRLLSSPLVVQFLALQAADATQNLEAFVG